MKKASFIVIFSFFLTASSVAGEYAGLTPGVSTKKEVEKEFGRPIREYKQDRKYDYSPEGHDLSALSVQFYDDDIAKGIHLRFKKPYTLFQIRQWFDLGRPDDAEQVKGHRVEVYRDKSIKIVFEGTDKAGGVIQLSHVDFSERRKDSSVDSCPAAAEKYASEADPFIEKDQHARAIAPLKKAAMCDPDKVIYSSMLAFAYWKEDQLNEAIDWAKKTLNIREDYIAYSVLGNAYWQKKNCDAALPYLEKAVSFSQDKGKDNLELLGACYYQKGRLNDALTTLVKSVKRDRQSFLTLYYLAATSDRLGNKPDAKFYYKKFLRTKKGNPDMIFAAKERLSVLSREASSSTRDKTGQATQMIIKSIFGNH